MFGRFFLGMLSLVSLAALSVGSFFRDAFGLFKVDPMFGLLSAPRMAMVGGPADSIDSSLFNFNRHESNVSRRSADRNI